MPLSLCVCSLQSRGHERIRFARDLLGEMSVKAKEGGTGEGKGGLSDHDSAGTPGRGGGEGRRDGKEPPQALCSPEKVSARLMGNPGAKVARKKIGRASCRERV